MDNKTDQLLTLYQERLTLLQGQLEEGLRQKLIRKSDLKERSKAIASLRLTLSSIQAERFLLGQGGQVQVDIGLPPISNLAPEERKLVKRYLGKRADSAKTTQTTLRDIGNWLTNRHGDKPRLGILSTYRLAAMSDTAAQLDKQLSTARMEFDQVNKQLGEICKLLGHQLIHNEFEGADLGAFLTELQSCDARIKMKEHDLAKCLGEESRLKIQVQAGLDNLRQPIPDLGMPEALSLALEEEPVMDTIDTCLSQLNYAAQKTRMPSHEEAS